MKAQHDPFLLRSYNLYNYVFVRFQFLLPLPVFAIVMLTYDGSKISTHITSKTKREPPFQVMSVIKSDRLLQPPLNSPNGFNFAGTSAEREARWMRLAEECPHILQW